MPATHEITLYDMVELTEDIESAPAGSRGGVVELLGDDMTLVEVMTMPLEPALDRIVFAPLAKLRRVDLTGATRAPHCGSSPAAYLVPS
ncbi:MAG: hypothetical protein ACRDWE_07030 [Acidimicrobiales bacterium]